METAGQHRHGDGAGDDDLPDDAAVYDDASAAYDAVSAGIANGHVCNAGAIYAYG